MGAVSIDEIENYKQIVLLDPDNLQEEFVTIPGHIAYWGTQCGQAHKRSILAYHARKRTYASVCADTDFFCHVADLVGRKPTKAEIELHAYGSDVYIAAVELEAETKGDLVAAEAVMTALITKRASLRQLGETKRAELLRDPTVMEEE